ncbi:MAG: hypothetical protein LC650_03860 [Actinobacteria bacterium]|nr:hypothetical protein [Actinomycetota bacterium]
MKVFGVVRIEEWEVPYHEKFFSTREKAEAYIAEHRAEMYGYGYYEVWEIEVE